MVVVPGLALLGCANFIPEPTYGLAPSDAAFVRQTCSQTMGLREGLEEFDACAESLGESLHRRVDARRLSRTHEACEKQGYAVGSRALAECVVLSAKEGNTTEKESVLPASSASDGAAPLAAPKRVSFFSMNGRVQDQHERLACAQLGLDPLTGEFIDCVIGIKQAIFTVQNPL
jgi:hypothetical protein